MHTLENDVLKVVISKHGAELQNIYHKKNDKEYLWQGDKAYWGRKSPILFPIVGKLAHNTYYVKGRDYHLPNHGFARDLDFEIIEKSNSYVKYMLKANEKTMLIYPYDFKLTVSYRLAGNKLTIKFKVYNKSEGLLYCSIGAHPAFNTNLTANGIEDYYLEFHENKTLRAKVVDTEVNLISRKEKLILENQNKLDLKYSLFDDDTLIFEDINKLSLKNNINDEEVIITCYDFPLLALWTSRNKANCPFISIEPLHGMSDYVGIPQEISDKPYIQSVYPNDKFRTKYTIEIK
jgi:galactose mutarotase-like enzyme